MSGRASSSKLVGIDDGSCALNVQVLEAEAVSAKGEDAAEAAGTTPRVLVPGGRAIRVSGTEEATTGCSRTDVALGDILHHYYVVHALPGRIRLRPRKRGMPVDMPALEKLAARFSGGSIECGERTGSVLLLFDAPVSKKALAAGKPRASVPAQAEEHAVRNPVPGKMRSFFYPRVVVFGLAVLRSIPYIFSGIKALLTGRLNLEVLDGAALVVCLLRRDFRSLSSITFFFALGEFLADWTRKKSRASLEESLALNIDKVWMRCGGVERQVPLAEVLPGDEIVVRAGYALPVDGTVIEGDGMVNQSSLTGESMPVHRSAGHTVYAGTVLQEGELVVAATKVGSQTRINALVRSIEESESVKAAVQGRYERVADAIVPYNFLLSGAVYAATRSPMRAGSVLLVDYSCAIRLTTPLSIFTAMREAAERGVLIKGGKFMEAVAEADVVVFDKTGTLTKAKPVLKKIVPFGNRKEDTVLRLAACLEEHFVHPVGQAVVRASDERGLKHREEHSKVEFVVAHGIASHWRGERVLIGSGHFVLEDEGVPITPNQEGIVREEAAKGRSALYLSVGGTLAGLLFIEDAIREDSADIVQRLREDGVKRVIMLTGDGIETAASVAKSAGIDEFHAALLPHQKAEFVAQLRKDGYKVAMVGDGVNDSPALSAANVGIAMADGADVAREVADIVLTNGELSGLLLARRISRQALKRIDKSFKSSVLWNSLFLAGGLLGVLTPALSALLHNATTAALAVSSVRPMLSPFEE